MSIYGFLFIGLIAGWLAGLIMKGGGLGLMGNLTVGVTGSFLGGYLFQFAGIQTGGFIGTLLTASFGAILILFVSGLIKQH